jgi:hypothetical protein
MVGAVRRNSPMLSVASFRAGITVDQRTAANGWRSQVLNAGDELKLAEFGLTCALKDVYRNTPLG